MSAKMNIASVLLAILAVADRAAAYSTFLPSARQISPPAAPARPLRRGQLEMKKGKPPVNMRSQFKQREQMQEQREAMVDSQRAGADGLPVFNLYVRSKKAQMWYPCGSFKGDERSKALAQTYKDDGFMSNMAKNQLDSGVSGSLATDERKLLGSIVRGYPQLKKAVSGGKDGGGVDWGYKLAFEGLSKEQAEMNIVVPKKREGGVVEGFKDMFGMND